MSRTRPVLRANPVVALSAPIASRAVRVAWWLCVPPPEAEMATGISAPDAE